MPTPPHRSSDGLGEAASSPQAAIKTWKEVKEGSSSAERPARYFGCTAISPSGNVPCRRMAGPTLRRAGGEQAISAGRARSFVRCWAHLWGARPELAGVVFLALDYASPPPKATEIPATAATMPLGPPCAKQIRQNQCAPAGRLPFPPACSLFYTVCNTPRTTTHQPSIINNQQPTIRKPSIHCRLTTLLPGKLDDT